jgi:hypothetical protein
LEYIYYSHLVHFWPFGTFLAIWYIFGHLVHFWPFGNLVSIWYLFPRFGILCKEKCGNPWSVADQDSENHMPKTSTKAEREKKFLLSFGSLPTAHFKSELQLPRLLP